MTGVVVQSATYSTVPTVHVVSPSYSIYPIIYPSTVPTIPRKVFGDHQAGGWFCETPAHTSVAPAEFGVAGPDWTTPWCCLTETSRYSCEGDEIDMKGDQARWTGPGGEGTQGPEERGRRDSMFRTVRSRVLKLDEAGRACAGAFTFRLTSPPRRPVLPYRTGLDASHRPSRAVNSFHSCSPYQGPTRTRSNRDESTAGWNWWWIR
jgi:hypothetical protein